MSIQGVAARDSAADAKTSALFERYYPGRAAELCPIELPIHTVTLLEDRAQVRRQGTVRLSAGRNRLLISGVAPVLQDVSLRGELAGDASETLRVSDLRVRRAMRVQTADKPAQAHALETQIETLTRRYEEVTEDRERAERRYSLLLDMLAKGVLEIPEDAAWGLVNRQVWADAFESSSKRAQELLDTSHRCYFEQLDVKKEVAALTEARRALDRQDVGFCAWIEVDVDDTRDAPGRKSGEGEPLEREVELSIEYVVPNALWRPLHSARLAAEGTLHFSSRAAVWHNTVEDWRDVKLIFSTARSSLGTEPPLLGDDLLAAQRRSEKVIVERRQVAIQSTGLGREPGAAPLPESAVELPGVDDGGDVQTLSAATPATVISDGRLCIVPVFDFSGAADRQLVCMPELAHKVFVRALSQNDAPHPILAGPVELIRDSGVVGWTKVLYVAPGERFSLSFGHDDGLRVYRTQKHESEIDSVDSWTHNDAWVHLHLSNLEGVEKSLEVVERIPVSEIEHVRVHIREEDCKPGAPKMDDHGLCRWEVTLPPNGRQSLCLCFRLSTAPEVEEM